MGTEQNKFRRMIFEETSLAYLKALKKNNNREWFATHKPTFKRAQDNAKEFYAAIRLGLEKHDEIEIGRAHV